MLVQIKTDCYSKKEQVKRKCRNESDFENRFLSHMLKERMKIYKYLSVVPWA